MTDVIVIVPDWSALTSAYGYSFVRLSDLKVWDHAASAWADDPADSVRPWTGRPGKLHGSLFVAPVPAAISTQDELLVCVHSPSSNSAAPWSPAQDSFVARPPAAAACSPSYRPIVLTTSTTIA